MNLGSEENPVWLYKYRALAGSEGQWVKDTILEKKIWLSSADRFNDPFDFFPAYILDCTLSEYRSYVRRLVRRQNPHAARPQRKQIEEGFLKHYSNREKVAEVLMLNMRRELTNLGVFCMSRRSDCPLMWGHYASSHSGVCLRFKAGESTSFIGGAQKIIYQKERPVMNPIKDNDDSRMEKTLLTKADYWSYEEEWRLVDVANGPGLLALPPRILDGVILGANISSDDRDRVLGWVAGQSDSIEILRAIPSNTTFEINIVPL